MEKQSKKVSRKPRKTLKSEAPVAEVTAPVAKVEDKSTYKSRVEHATGSVVVTY